MRLIVPRPQHQAGDLADQIQRGIRARSDLSRLRLQEQAELIARGRAAAGPFLRRVLERRPQHYDGSADRMQRAWARTTAVLTTCMAALVALL